MKKGFGDKVLGWFVVEEEADAGSAGGGDDLAKELAEAVPVPRHTSVRARAPVAPSGNMQDARDFGAVYREAGVGDEERDRLAKVLTLLESLPEEAGIDVKRSIVGASLEAFGVSIDRILVTGEGALAALDGHVASGQSRTREVLAQAESRVAKLTAEIEEGRRRMDLAIAAQQELTQAVTKEKSRVRSALEFFANGAAARTAPPRLVRLK
jgi:hypothetical protein